MTTLRPRPAAQTLALLAATIAAVGVALAPAPAEASPATMQRALGNILWSPLDLALSPIVLLVTFAIFAIVFAAKRIVSLGSIVGAIALPIVVFVLDKTGVSPSHWSLQAVSIAITIVVLVKHKSNVKRLLAGEEPALQRTKGSYGG